MSLGPEEKLWVSIHSFSMLVLPFDNVMDRIHFNNGLMCACALCEIIFDCELVHVHCVWVRKLCVCVCLSIQRTIVCSSNRCHAFVVQEEEYSIEGHTHTHKYTLIRQIRPSDRNWRVHFRVKMPSLQLMHHLIFLTVDLLSLPVSLFLLHSVSLLPFLFPHFVDNISLNN